MLLKLLLVSNNAYIVAILNIERSTMNNENEAMDTEIPIKVSEKERAIVLEALERVKRGEVISHEEMELYIDNMVEELKIRKKQRELLKVGS